MTAEISKDVEKIPEPKANPTMDYSQFKEWENEQRQKEKKDVT